MIAGVVGMTAGAVDSTEGGAEEETTVGAVIEVEEEEVAVQEIGSVRPRLAAIITLLGGTIATGVERTNPAEVMMVAAVVDSEVAVEVVVVGSAEIEVVDVVVGSAEGEEVIAIGTAEDR